MEISQEIGDLFVFRQFLTTKSEIDQLSLEIQELTKLMKEMAYLQMEIAKAITVNNQSVNTCKRAYT